MLIPKQLVLGKTNNKRKILMKVLRKRFQLTYLLKVNQLILNSQRLKLVKKTGRLIHTDTEHFCGFTIVKIAGERFLEHETSECHKDYKKLLDMADDEVDIGEQMNGSLVNEKAKDLQMFLMILQNIQFLTRQGLAIRKNEDQGNFDQLMKFSSKIIPRITSWIEKKNRNNYLHNDSQNEILKLMALTMLRDIAKNINDNVFFSIMAVETNGRCNNEQLVVCIK